MAIAYAWIDGRRATPAEKARSLDTQLPKTPTEGQLFGELHHRGERAGQLYVNVEVPTPPGTPFADRYRIALDALLTADKRIRNGYAYSVGII